MWKSAETILPFSFSLKKGENWLGGGGGFMFQCFVFFLIFAFSFALLFFDFLKPKSVPSDEVIGNMELHYLFEYQIFFEPGFGAKILKKYEKVWKSVKRSAGH